MSDTESTASDKEAREKRREENRKRREKIRSRNQYIRNRNQRIVATRHADAQRWRTKKPEVGKIDMENFKNRYCWTTEYEEYAVEALVGPWDLHEQYRDEKKRRQPQDFFRRQSNIGMLSGLTMPGMRAENLNRDFRGPNGKSYAAPDVDLSELYIHRIRINSIPILGYLTDFMGLSSEREQPRTFMRPYMTLVYFQPYMKKMLARLEERLADAEVNKSQREDATDRKVAVPGEADIPEELAAQHTITTLDQTLPQEQDADLAVRDGDLQTLVERDTKGDTEENDASDAEEEIASIYTAELESIRYDVEEQNKEIERLMTSAEALQDMRCYVRFMEKEIMPHFEFLRGQQAEKVIFDDLWCVFRPGDLIYSHNMGPNSDRGEELWRLYRVRIPRFTTSYEHVGSRTGENGQYRADDKVTLYCYHIDYDGSTYGAVRRKFDIPYFPGRRAIRSLAVYPLRFAKNCDGILESLRSRGQKFQNAFAQRHQSYQNWTLETELKTSSEFIEGHVIVDFEETFKKMPHWCPSFHHPSINKETTFDENHEDWDILFWKDKPDEASSSYFVCVDRIIQDHAIQLFERRDLFYEDRFWERQSKTFGFDTYDSPEQATTIKDADLVLLPKRSFAYTLRERKFVTIDINHLRPVPIDIGIFDSLKISRDYKDIIRGLISSHFQKKELERLYTSRSVEGLSQDLIRGKGKGLVVLLHGAPGVGKTATAEAVAMENNKPLFTITCGDLGLTPSEVETSLNDIFRLAHKWECVLLLDEADVFLSQRSRFDLKRNALVSVFLRVLEYYNGLLFLTTNRVGTIDEAFKSRIHMSLYYPPLNKIQTTEIFRLNVLKLRQIEQQKSSLINKPQLIINEKDIIEFAEKHFDENNAKGGCWNGRQIRNSFQIASSLAYYHYEKKVREALTTMQEPPKAPELDSRFFNTVQHATHHFNQYMEETKGWSDADLAHKLGDRSDYLKGTRFPSTDDPQNPQATFTTQAPNAGLGQYPGTLSPSPGMAFPGQIPMHNAAAQYQSPEPQGYHTPQQQSGRTVHFGGVSPYNIGVAAPTTPGRLIFQPTPQAGAAHMQTAFTSAYTSTTSPQPPSTFLANSLEASRGSSSPFMGGHPVVHEQMGRPQGEASGPWAESGAQHAMQPQTSFQTSEEDLYR